MLIILQGIVLTVAFTTLLERKVMGAMQRRIGPNQVGYLGQLQPITDGVKQQLKESIQSQSTHSSFFFVAPFLTFYLAQANWLFIPLNQEQVVSEIPGAGIFLLIVLTELGIFGIQYAGWSANSKYPLQGSMRSTAQMISYSISLSLQILSVIFLLGDQSLMKQVNSSEIGSRWLLLSPLIPLFVISAIAETNRAPFDLPEAESELVAGFFTEHSAVGFVFFFLGEYTSIQTISTLFSIFFLGTYEAFFLLLFFILWIRAVLPRLRFDQLLSLGWMSILPLAITYGAILLPCLIFTFDFIA